MSSQLNGMEMHVERRKTCNQGTVPKHFHPAAGTDDHLNNHMSLLMFLIWVVDGNACSQSKSS